MKEKALKKQSQEAKSGTTAHQPYPLIGKGKKADKQNAVGTLPASKPASNAPKSVDVKPVSKKSDIDLIFQKKKDPKVISDKSSEESKKDVKKNEKEKRDGVTKGVVETVTFSEIMAKGVTPKPSSGGDDGFADSRGLKITKRTDDGLPVFDVKDLKIGDGNGDTPSCPFDCWCCY
ncbi:hypothetical protein BC829DRAFT_378944 [Chytridium lagenaria]|nr:hypothetical protein BC829DRAFT_378944 [Chytridium lagenaria]